MVNRFIIWLPALIGLAFASVCSCVPEQLVDNPDAGLVTREFDASFAGNETKTSLSNGGKVLWSAGDVINYITPSMMQKREFRVPESGASTHLSLQMGESDFFVAAAYGGYVIPGAGSSIVVGDVVPAQQSGRFNAAHVSVAFTYELESGKLQFHNLTSLLSFRLQRNDIAYVIFRPATEVPSGKVNISVASGYPDISSLTPAGKTVSEIKVQTSSGAGEYYISLLPGTISGGFEMEFYDSSNTLLGTASSSNNLSLKVNTILNLGILDDKIEVPEQHGGGTKSGLYLGIIGFNDELYKMDIERLDANSKTRFDAFINGLTTKNGTLLYYSVDQSLRTFKQAQYPSDLYNVSLVTFTDGLDMGSAMMMDNYTTDDECLEGLHNRLSTSSFAGIPLTAYSVGLTGNDVNTTQQREMFRKNIKKLAYPESNAYEVDDMSSVNARFQEIADKISQTTSTTKYQLEFTVPGKAEGTMWRITLDGASSATSSSMYIEGTFNLSTKALTNVTYHGMTCSSGSTVQGVVNGIHITYTFSDIVPDGERTLSKDKVWTWYYVQSSSNFWQGNTEFSQEEDVKIIVIHTKQSVVVLLDLDCSRSLDNQFTTLKNYAKSFVATLYNASVDPYDVTGISLDKATLNLYVGASATLSATVSPSTAADKSVQWSSSNRSVATVDSGGNVTGISAGTATVTAATYDGSFTASCFVTVKEAPKPEAVDLGLSVKWASWNVGASAPEEHGDYFAWGETSLKSDYDWPTYKWCKGGSSMFTKYNTSSSYGNVDNKTVLDLSDDVAHANWGGSWRMPTNTEWTELRNNCTWTWTSQGGHNGYQVTSKTNGNSIFLSASGGWVGMNLYVAESEGYYWSSSLCAVDPNYATVVAFDSNEVGCYDYIRSNGFSVRPVYGAFVAASSISLNRNSICVGVGGSFQLAATVSPSNATEKAVYWVSSNSNIAMVLDNGLVIAIADGSATITASASSGKSATCTVSVASDQNYQGHDAVDLGLSVKWATCNVGASNPENYGDYFAWGETTAKNTYSWSTYRWCNGSSNTITKYNNNSSYGTVDNQTILQKGNDAASVNWGGSWRMPTDAEWTELRNNCTWTWITHNEVRCQLFTSKKNGNSILLPAAGSRFDTQLPGVRVHGFYWSSSLNTNLPDHAWGLFLNDFGVERSDENRYYGQSVRPVTE